MDILRSAAERGIRYLEELGERPVGPRPEAIAALDSLDIPFPDESTPAEQMLQTLDELGSPATVGSPECASRCLFR